MPPPPPSHRDPPAPTGAGFAGRAADRLIPYFRSGWAFLIPYLAVYLLYAGQKWPVHTAGHTAAPALLHVYWALHLIHLLLAALALAEWQRRESAATSTSWFDPARLARVAPWLCLALLFWIPGVYLEFPADTWEHYSRINEWSWLDTVTAHSNWKKSGSFLAYSLIGPVAPPARQLAWLDAYYTAGSLLLCWQYYRLARAAGLGRQTGLLFVFLQALLFGNNLFGFYRYYAISTTLFAQLGAVALVRVALEVLGGTAGSRTGPARLPWTDLISGGLLLALIAFNHVQGLGIALLGIAAVAVWRLIAWRRWLAVALPAGAVLLSVAAVLAWPRHPSLDAVYRPAGWLTAWYGFNFFSLSSPTFDRTAAILGCGGLLNFVAGVWLLRRNHPAGWLTVMPVLALALPVVAIPFANILAADPNFAHGYIIAFHRMLFAIPPGLALVVLGAGRSENPPVASPAGHRAGFARFALLLAALSALLIVPPSGKYFNRFFNFAMTPPDDLAMRHVIAATATLAVGEKIPLTEAGDRREALLVARGGLLTTPGIGYVLNATGTTLIAGARARMTWPTVSPPSTNTGQALENLLYVDRARIRDLPFWPVPALFTPGSQTGYLSQHWLGSEVALEHAAQNELFAAAVRARPAEATHAPQIWLEWSSFRDQTPIAAKGAGLAGEFIALDDRGRLDTGAGNQLIKAGDRLALRSRMRTPDGNGWRVTLEVRGPGISTHRESTGVPTPLGGAGWINGDDRIELQQPGEYTVEIAGTTLWPVQTCTVRYHFMVQAE